MIRSYRRRDRDAVYRICLETGDSGQDATQLYEDPMLLGHLYAGPYVTLEPDLAFVLEDRTGVCGYVVGALDTRSFRRAMLERWLPPLQAKLPKPNADLDQWAPADHLYHQIHHPREEYPEWLERFPSHLHIDLLPGAQGRGHGRALMETLFAALVKRGSRGVHLGVGVRNVRAQGFYAKMGFSELERNEHAVRMVRRLP